MADPTPYVQAFDFSDYQASNPASPLPGDRVDIELAALAGTSLDAVNAIKDVRRSDGALKNAVVTPDSLAPGLIDFLELAYVESTAADVLLTHADVVLTHADVVLTHADAAQTAIDAATATLAAGQLEAVLDVMDDFGFYFDWGLITEAPGEILDYGSIA